MGKDHISFVVSVLKNTQSTQLAHGGFAEKENLNRLCGRAFSDVEDRLSLRCAKVQRPRGLPRVLLSRSGLALFRFFTHRAALPSRRYSRLSERLLNAGSTQQFNLSGLFVSQIKPV